MIKLLNRKFSVNLHVNTENIYPIARKLLAVG
jgi:hypothetical protein